MANVQGSNSVFLNNNKGESWTKMSIGPEFNSYDIIVADLNGDGRPDIIEANSDEQNVFHINAVKRNR